MTIDRLTPLLAQRPWLRADGATGSNLFARGSTSGEAPELWNTEHPQRISDLQRSFIEAGADIILTNSFGGNRHRLKLHQAEHRVAELNEAAARLARDAEDRADRTARSWSRWDRSRRPRRAIRSRNRRRRSPGAVPTFCGSRRCPQRRRPKRRSAGPAARGF